MDPYLKSKLKSKLYYDHRTHTVPKTMFENNVITNVLRDEKEVSDNNSLLKGIYDLKKKGLLKNRGIKANKMKADTRITNVYNDYHRKITNPGYSRKWGGNGGLYFH